MNNQKLLTIAIPTYNRATVLAKNLRLLLDIILKNNLKNLVDIVILNNASPDNTVELVAAIISENPEISAHFHSQNENVGVLRSIIDLLSLSEGHYILYLGDDDFINANYLIAVLNKLETDSNTACIIPSYQNITSSGNPIGVGRDINRKSRSFNAGFASIYQNSWRGHQMSGLVFLRERVLTEYKKYKICNLYLWLFFVSSCAYIGNTYHLTENPILVTRPGQSNKTWGYEDDGLISHVFDNYKAYTRLNYFQRVLLQLKFLDVQYWRYAMYLKLGFGKFLKALCKITFGKNTLLATRILFPILLPIIAVKKVISFAFSGQLLEIINTKVDI